MVSILATQYSVCRVSKAIPIVSRWESVDVEQDCQDPIPKTDDPRSMNCRPIHSLREVIPGSEGTPTLVFFMIALHISQGTCPTTAYPFEIICSWLNIFSMVENLSMLSRIRACPISKTETPFPQSHSFLAIFLDQCPRRICAPWRDRMTSTEWKSGNNTVSLEIRKRGTTNE